MTGAQAGFVQGIEELEHGALISRRQLLHELQSLTKPGGLGRRFLGGGLEAEQR